MSVDTYLQGKNLDPYTVVSDGEVEVLLSPHLVRWASEVNLDVKKRLVGKKLIAIARLEGKRKFSQNRGEADREGVALGLLATGDPASRAVAALIPRSGDPA